ncbi:retrovirus-related pol polyprotein from transposon TNT 1-94 [Tanacetum coccineum]
MSTHQDIYAAGSKNRPPMLNKENYVPWSSRLLRYAKSRPNGKLIYNSIMNGPYVRRMIPKPGDADHEVETDDQAIQTILLGLPEDIYAVVDSCETAQEIWLRVKQMMKGSDIGIQERKVKLFNEWERFTSTNGELTESYYHRFSKLMNDFKRNKHFLEKIASNLKFLNNLQPEWSRRYNQKDVDELRAEQLGKTHDPLALMANSNNPFNYPVFHQDQPSSNITDPTTAMNIALVLMAKAFKLNYSTTTNNNQRISLNPSNRQISQPVQNVGNQVVQNAVQNPGVQNVGNQNRLIVVPGIANQNPNENGNVVAAWAGGNANGNNGQGEGMLLIQTQLLIAQKEEAGIQLPAKEFDLMASTSDLNEIEEVNANCILMANLGGTVEQHPATVEETRAYFESLYNNLATEVEKVTTVNRKLRETNANLTTELARYKNQEKCFEISQEKYDKLERAAKFVQDFKSLAKEAGESLAKHKALELEIERLLRALVSQDIMSIAQNNSVVDTSHLQTELEQCKYEKISYDKAYNDMQQKIEHLQAQLGDLKGKSKDTPGVSDTLDPLSQNLENENVDLEFQLFDKVFKQKDTTKGTSTNIKFANQSTERKLSLQSLRNTFGVRQPNAFQSERLKFSKIRVPLKVDKTNDLSNPVTLNSVPTTKESKVVETDKVISPGMFRINPFKNSKEENCVPIKPIKSSVRTNPITISQPLVITKKVVNSNSNGFSSTGVDITTKTRRPQPRSNTKNDRVPSASKSSRIKNKEVEGLGHNLFSVGQFCDLDLEVAFRRNTCFVRNLEGVDLLKGNRTTKLYTINLHDMASTSPIFLIACATTTKSWLWHQCLSHLNFDTINDLARNDIVTSLPKFKYHKEHLCPSCEEGKSKRASHPPKPVPNSKQRLHLLHMDLYGPMRIASINGKRYVMVIVEDYSRYTWVHFLRSKDEAPEEIKTFLKKL